MAKIVDLQAYRTRNLVHRAFGPWRRRLDENYDETTCLADLSDKTLHLLAVPGEKSSAAYYELIMGILDMGDPARFYYLEKGQQLLVVDTHLFIADQVRFEMMKRLGWVADYYCQQNSLLNMVQNVDELKMQSRSTPPLLSESHPQYSEYRDLPQTEKEAFIRRLLPKALEAFQNKLSS